MSRSEKPLNKRRGFLLLEVLVSITIISVGLIYVVRSFSSSTRAIERASRLLKSISFAEEKLWELEAKGTIERGSDEGKFFKDDEGYKWITKAEGLKESPLNRVELKVEREGPKKGERLSLETYLWNEED